MLAVDCPRPAKLYYYAHRASLERALSLGEFCLQPAAPASTQDSQNDQILPFRPKQATLSQSGNYLTLRLAQVWNESLFDSDANVDCCLVIHDAEQFGERIHRAAQDALPNWAGIDAAVSYGIPSPLGAVFSKARQLASQREWLFAWRPMQPGLSSHPIVIKIGNIEAIAELRGKSS